MIVYHYDSVYIYCVFDLNSKAYSMAVYHYKCLYIVSLT